MFPPLKNPCILLASSIFFSFLSAKTYSDSSNNSGGKHADFMLKTGSGGVPKILLLCISKYQSINLFYMMKLTANAVHSLLAGKDGRKDPGNKFVETLFQSISIWFLEKVLVTQRSNECACAWFKHFRSLCGTHYGTNCA